ncbi:MAG: hypothetical protein U9N60_07305 [Thermodesulfobacteriota bacterium]|nr:hypothetical protein [Thermodesulfobacteriota bacterium]
MNRKSEDLPGRSMNSTAKRHASRWFMDKKGMSWIDFKNWSGIFLFRAVIKLGWEVV